MAELKAITPRAYELIRDKIGLILATELPKQATLNADTRLNSTVFVERFVPVEDSEILDSALVIVSLSDSSFGLETNYTVDGEFTFYIDCYEKAKATAGNKADERASFRLQRIAGVIHGILSDSQFNTLKFARPFIENTTIKSIKIADPKNAMDASSVVMARIEFVVRAAESKQLIDPVPIVGYTTQAVLGLTDLGYNYGTHDMPPVNPICADAIIQLNGTQVVSADSGATVDIPIKDSAGYTVGSWNGNEFIVPSGGDATAIDTDTNGTVLHTNTIAAGGTNTQIIADSVVSNSDDSFVANLLAEGNLVLPDTNFNFTYGGTTTIVTVPSMINHTITIN